MFEKISINKRGKDVRPGNFACGFDSPGGTFNFFLSSTTGGHQREWGPLGKNGLPRLGLGGAFCGEIFLRCHVVQRNVPISQVFDGPLTVFDSNSDVDEDMEDIRHVGDPPSDSWWRGFLA